MTEIKYCIKEYLEGRKQIVFLEEPNIEILKINARCIWKLFVTGVHVMSMPMEG